MWFNLPCELIRTPLGRSSQNGTTPTLDEQAMLREDGGATARPQALYRRFLMYAPPWADAIVHKNNREGATGRSDWTRTAGGGKRKAGPLWEGEDSEGPGSTIDQIVVPARAGAYTPPGVSLYARWLFLEAKFAEFTSHATPMNRARRRAAAPKDPGAEDS